MLIFLIFLNLDFAHSKIIIIKKVVLIVDTNTNKLKEYSYENTIHNKFVITNHSWHYNRKIEGIFVGEFQLTQRRSEKGVYRGSQKNVRIIMEHLQRTSLGNWDSCYADNQDDQNSGNKSRQTQDIVVSIKQ